VAADDKEDRMNIHHDPRQRRVAGNLIGQAVRDLAQATAAPVSIRQAVPSSPAKTADVEPLAGLAASRQLELAAREHAAGYVRAAREAGYSWHDIGTTLELDPDRDAEQTG
jgi:hypothetical protein